MNKPQSVTALPKRIAYFFDWKFNPEMGVPQKILAQIKIWRREGYYVDLILVVPQTMKPKWERIGDSASYYTYRNIFGRYKARTSAAESIINNNYNCVYMRFGILTPKQIKIIKQIPTILEINTINKYEARHWSPNKRLLYYLSERFALKQAAGLAVVTREIQKYYKAKFPAQQIECFPNSIILDEIQVQPAPNNKRPQLIFVGSPNRPWHGVDRIFTMAQTHPQYDFHIVGATQKKSTFNNLYVHPEIYENELLIFLSKMDIAISTLALERNFMREASPLKTRLYLACGLPVVMGYLDTACTTNDTFYLYAGEETALDSVAFTNNLDKFIMKWKGKRVSRDQLQNFDATFVERNRLQFINAISF